MNKIIAVHVAVLAAALAVAGCGSIAAPVSAVKPPVSATETITGHLTGRAAMAAEAVFPLTYRGPVDTSGSFRTGGPGSQPVKGQMHAFRTKAGVMEARVVSVRNKQSPVNTGTCVFSFATTVHFALVGGKSTGSWAGDSGTGAVTVGFRGVLPRVKAGKRKGRCNESPAAAPLAEGAVASFTAAETVRLKGR